MRKTKSKNFQTNLIYVFSYKKYKESKKMRFEISNWVKELNGRLVTQNVNPNRAGTILGTGYSINIKWCKCIGRKNNDEKRNRPSHHRA
ncbi:MULTISPECIES: hypothetical protein [Clostridium]|uniref:Uncharacterized protein n=1 Tax=Clostridium frigoriphilum TaxID=443253 RepID=A0ABU7UK62_9CLOT|nr:hypothetical protein [Clostridium sp. DSM 17811]MBU3098351.1 hypothetical protein [Clostridium sp. DSM 17811]